MAEDSELDPKIANAHIEGKETEFKVKLND